MMETQKILVVGDGGSVFVKNFIEQFSSTGVVIDLISISASGSLPDVRRQWNCGSTSPSKGGKLFGHFNLYRRLRLAIVESDVSYDCVVIHYVFSFLFPHLTRLSQKTKNLTAVVWGSDFYIGGFLTRKLREMIFRRARHIVFTNPKTKEDFARKIPCRAQLEVARFGLPVLSAIDKIKEKPDGREELCQFFSVPRDKVLVLVGYNSNRSQNQTLVIKKLRNLSQKLRDEIHLVFPLGYGIHDVTKEIESSLLEENISNYSILRKFYNPDEVAKLRCITDVLINIQPTDQFSGSMQETLYAGGLVLTGSWLPYDQIRGVDGNAFFVVDEPEQVGEAVEEIIKNKEKYIGRPNVSMKNFIRKTSGWEENFGLWRAIVFCE